VGVPRAPSAPSSHRSAARRCRRGSGNHGLAASSGRSAAAAARRMAKAAGRISAAPTEGVPSLSNTAIRSARRPRTLAPSVVTSAKWKLSKRCRAALAQEGSSGCSITALPAPADSRAGSPWRHATANPGPSTDEASRGGSQQGERSVGHQGGPEREQQSPFLGASASKARPRWPSRRF